MGVWYTNRAAVKAALTIPVTTTGQDAALDAVMESISREIDLYVGFGFAPSSGPRDYTPKHADTLDLDYPLLSIDSLVADHDANASYEVTMTATTYYLTPTNATAETPRRPFWGLDVRQTATAVFPKAIQRGVRITGTWGYYDERRTSSSVLTTSVNSTALTLTLTNASQLSAGHLLLLDSERIQVTDVSTTAATGTVVGVLRGRNGTSGAAHSSGAIPEVYEFPVVERAALYQAELDYRVKDAPFGMAGGEAFGAQSPQPGGGLHPFTKRLLDQFRVPGAY